MKKILTLVLTAVVLVFTVPIVLPGCKTPPSERVVQVQTLKAVGQTAEAAMEQVVGLYKTGAITAAQDRAISEFYDQKFQPAFRLARNAVNGDLSTAASPDITALLQQFLILVANLKK